MSRRKSKWFPELLPAILDLHSATATPKLLHSRRRNKIRTCRRRLLFCRRQRLRRSRLRARGHRPLQRRLLHPSPPPRLTLPLRRRREKFSRRGLFVSTRLLRLLRGSGEACRCRDCLLVL